MTIDCFIILGTFILFKAAEKLEYLIFSSNY